MRDISRAALRIFVATVVLIGCDAQGVTQPVIGRPSTSEVVRTTGEQPKKGIYVSTSDGAIKGFSIGGKRLLCTISEKVNALDDIAVDPKGNLIVPLGESYASGSVAVYRGPNMCGHQAGSFSDPYGFPVNAASLDAITGTIAVANATNYASESGGNIAICTLSGGCTKELTGPNIIGAVGGIAIAKNGDCWLTSTQWYDASKPDLYHDSAQMTYWKGCDGMGQAVTGYQNEAYGSVSIDSQGNLVSLDEGNYYSRHSQLWVYKGCNPQCTLVGGPFPLRGRWDTFGGLNDKSDEYGVTDLKKARVDVYSYSATRVTYKYSFPDSLPTYTVIGFAFSPSPNF